MTDDGFTPRKEYWISPGEMDDLMRIVRTAERLMTRLERLPPEDFDGWEELRALEAALEQHRDPVDYEGLEGR